MYSDSSSNGLGTALLVFFGIAAVFYVVSIWGMVRIVRRSGYSGWWILSGIVPLLNVVMFLLFAFKETPRERELKQLRAWADSMRGYGQQGPAPQGGQWR